MKCLEMRKEGMFMIINLLGDLRKFDIRVLKLVRKILIVVVRKILIVVVIKKFMKKLKKYIRKMKNCLRNGYVKMKKILGGFLKNICMGKVKMK